MAKEAPSPKIAKSNDEPEGGKKDKSPGRSAPPEEKKDMKAEKEKGFVRLYWLLFVGVLLALIGLGGVIGLRLNIVQIYILGIQDPYPGIGYLEPQGHVASIVPYCIGLILYVWGLRAEALPKREREVPEEGIEEEEAKEELEAEKEFGHDHLPPPHLSAEEKIEHLAKARAEGRISEGLYKESLERFEAELKEEEDREKEEAELLASHHLGPQEKIEKLTRSYARGKISKALFEKNLTKFEEELRKEEEAMPPPHLSAREKIDHLENAYRMGSISQGTYEKNLALFQKDLEAEKPKAPEGLEELEGVAEEAEDDEMIRELYSLLEEIEEPEEEKKRKKKGEESFEEGILREIEDLENL